MNLSLKQKKKKLNSININRERCVTNRKNSLSNFQIQIFICYVYIVLSSFHISCRLHSKAQQQHTAKHFLSLLFFFFNPLCYWGFCWSKKKFLMYEHWAMTVLCNQKQSHLFFETSASMIAVGKFRMYYTHTHHYASTYNQLSVLILSILFIIRLFLSFFCLHFSFLVSKSKLYYNIPFYWT